MIVELTLLKYSGLFMFHQIYLWYNSSQPMLAKNKQISQSAHDIGGTEHVFRYTNI